MSKKIEISKIIVKIGDTETPLTVDQARELKEVLASLLGETKEKVVYVPDLYPMPYRKRYWIVEPDWTYQPSSQSEITTTNYTVQLKS